MNTPNKVSVTGRVKIFMNGELIRDITNLVVTAGHGFIASRMGSASDTVMTHMAIGTGTTAAVIADTTLETESTRQALAVSGGTVSTNTVTYERTFAADDPDVTAPAVAAITEAGLFNDATTGTMLARTVFPVINKGETDVMTISWVVTIS